MDLSSVVYSNCYSEVMDLDRCSCWCHYSMRMMGLTTNLEKLWSVKQFTQYQPEKECLETNHRLALVFDFLRTGSFKVQLDLIRSLHLMQWPLHFSLYFQAF